MWLPVGNFSSWRELISAFFFFGCCRRGLVLRSQASYVVSVVCIFFIGRLRLSPAGGWLCSVLALLDGARRWELGLSRCPDFFYLHNLWNFSAASSAIQTINLISVLDLQVSRRFASSAVHGTFPDEFTIQWVTFSVDCFLDALIMTNTLNPEP